jgi:hypothetical protein
VRFSAFLLVCVWLFVAIGAAQSANSASPASNSAPQPPQEASPTAKQRRSDPRVADSGVKSRAADKNGQDAAKQNQEQTAGVSNDRLFWTLPNFLTVNSTHLPPLTAGQKFKVVARGTFDPVEYAYIAFLAGISQAEDSEPGYGQGAAGYGKRYGAAFTDNAIENFMTAAILPSLLKQDPRFYQSDRGGFGRRLGYAMSRIVVTHSDSGHTQFNFSEVAGSAMAAAISTYSYHPSGDRTLRNTGSVWGTQVGWDTVTLVVKEFWPDIRRKLRRKQDRVDAVGPEPASDGPSLLK